MTKSGKPLELPDIFCKGTPSQEPPTKGERIMGDGANTVAFTPDGRYLAVGLFDGVYPTICP
jgi:hypothetical protein